MPTSIRDRLGWDLFIPLFAGMDAGQRSLGYNVYAPNSNVGGTGQGPGGIGEGDGGFSTPDDPTVNKPSITAPACESQGVSEEDTATSSAFGSTNGQTHVASRWMVELISDEGDFLSVGTGIIIYDSGLDTIVPTAIDLMPMGLQTGYSYAIRVRHKGSNGGWSPWSDSCSFRMGLCIPELLFWLDAKAPGALADVSGTTLNSWVDETGNRTVVNTGAGDSTPVVDEFGDWGYESVKWGTGDDMRIDPPITGKFFTIFLAGRDGTAAMSRSHWGLAGGNINDDTSVIGMISFSTPDNYKTPIAGWRNSNGTSEEAVPSVSSPGGGQKAVVAIRVDAQTPTVDAWYNGVKKTMAYYGLPNGTMTFDRIGQGALTYSDLSHVYAEVRVYDGLLTDEDIQDVTAELQAKWSI